MEKIKISYGDIGFDLSAQLKCLNCPAYGRTYRCPPYAPPFFKFREKLKEYNDFSLIIRRYDITDVLNEHRANNRDKKETWTLNSVFLEIYRTKSQSFSRDISILRDRTNLITGKKPDLALSCGGCKLCKPCEIKDNQGCKKPNESLYSLEAVGIDVYKTLKNLNTPIQIPPRSYITNVGLLASKEPGAFFTQKNSNFNYPEIPEWINQIKNEKKGRILFKEPIDDIEDLCQDCGDYSPVLCNRKYAPLKEVREWIKGKEIHLVEFSNSKELVDNLFKWSDMFHREGKYWNLFFGNQWINSDERKKIVRCIKFMGIEPLRKGNFGYLIV